MKKQFIIITIFSFFKILTYGQVIIKDTASFIDKQTNVVLSPPFNKLSLHETTLKESKKILGRPCKKRIPPVIAHSWEKRIELDHKRTKSTLRFGYDNKVLYSFTIHSGSKTTINNIIRFNISDTNVVLNTFGIQNKRNYCNNCMTYELDPYKITFKFDEKGILFEATFRENSIKEKKRLENLKNLTTNKINVSSISNSFGLKSLENFKGDLTFKDSWYYAPLSRLFYDTLINYSTIHVSDSLEMEQMAFLYPEKVLTQKFIPFKFFKKNDSIFLKYFDPIINKTTSDYIYPLNIRDTVDIPVCYQMYIDSFRIDGSKTYKKSLSENDDEMSNNLRAIYSKDTILTFGEYKMSCYMFEQSKLTGHYRDVNFVRKILIDKILLVPIDIKEYHYYKTRRRSNRQIPKEKWLLTRHTRLIYIDN